MNSFITSCLERYDAIGLAALNEKAEMLERLDNKYIIPAGLLLQALQAMISKFDVLDINGKRVFSYETRYFDDCERRGYYDHHQRKRKRCKARVRHYVDTGLSFLEVKLNEHRATTAKRRLQVAAPLTALDECCLDFVRECYRQCYGDEFTKPLEPVILIKYERITLVAKEGGERLTIDTALRFEASHRAQAAPEDMCVIETKSARANGIADKIFRSLHAQPTRRVSKFCIGMAVTGQVIRHNGFLPALRKLHLFELAQQGASLALQRQRQRLSSRTSFHESQTHLDSLASDRLLEWSLAGG
jgi:hypothetical protein